MKLLLDLGNTRLKLGWLHRQCREPGVQALLPADVPTALPTWLAALPERPTGAWGAAVGQAAVRQQIDDLLHDTLGFRVHWQRARAHALGLVNGYQQPESLGVDRWLALLSLHAHARHAAARQRRAARLMVTFGTATTIDALTPDGRFPGGLIVPGIDLMRRALNQGTANLPHSAGGWMDYPDQTHAAIHSGIVAAQLGGLERQLGWLQRDFPEGPWQIVLSGGALPALREPLGDWQRRHPAVLVEIVDNPVLDGLSLLAAQPSAQTSSHA